MLCCRIIYVLMFNLLLCYTSILYQIISFLMLSNVYHYTISIRSYTLSSIKSICYIFLCNVNAYLVVYNVMNPIFYIVINFLCIMFVMSFSRLPNIDRMTRKIDCFFINPFLYSNKSYICLYLYNDLGATKKTLKIQEMLILAI